MANMTTFALESHSAFIAAIDIVVSITLMTTYAPTIYVITTNEKFYKHASYKFILLMAFYDMIELIAAGPVSAVYQMTTGLMPDTVKVWGAITMFGWFGYLATIGCLSIERFFKVWSMSVWYRVFDGYRIYCWIVSLIVYSLVLGAVVLTKHHQFLYFSTSYSWYYFETPDRGFIQLLAVVIGLISPIVMIIVYVSIFIKHRNMSQVTEQGSTSKQERQILYQCALVSSIMVLTEIAYHVVPVVSSNKWAYWACHLMWITNSGTNGLIYMTFNKSMRDAVMSLIKTGIGANEVHPVGITAGNQPMSGAQLATQQITPYANIV